MHFLPPLPPLYILIPFYLHTFNRVLPIPTAWCKKPVFSCERRESCCREPGLTVWCHYCVKWHNICVEISQAKFGFICLKFSWMHVLDVLYKLAILSSEHLISLFLKEYFSIFEFRRTRFLSLLDFILSHSVTGDIIQVMTWQWVYTALHHPAPCLHPWPNIFTTDKYFIRTCFR